jgi:DNA-directed RNA polymerase subunit RPC12/RpoP
MALITCPECSKQVSDQAKSCPGCGYPIKVAQVPSQIANRADNYVKGTLGFSETWGGYSISEEVVCPHCSKRGCVATRRLKAKKGISGAKTTGALLTCGLSILATGLSRKEWVTDAKCKNCGSQWQF